MAISSSMITFIDTTDTQKVDVHISSNYPLIQIYDTNTGKFTPSWIATSDNSSLELSATVYADSTDVSDPNLFSTTYQWFKDKVEEDPLFTTRSIVIDDNVLDKSETGMVTYICKVTYGGESYENRITFSLVKTGANGISAPSVQAQYSVDGTNGSWESVLDSSVHKYIHFSYDGGFNWTSPIKIAGEKGEDGQSVSLKGTAYTTDELVVGGAVTLYVDSATQNVIRGEESGDSYLVDGYLCVYNGSQFICTGQLQGPKGEDGATYYLYIRYADNMGGSGFSTSPDNKKYIGFYRTTAATLPTNIDKTSATWNWAKFVGDNAKTITLTGSAQAFKVDKNNAVLPTTIKVTAQVENTSVTSWTYRVDNEATFTSNIPIGVSQNGNDVTITGSEMTSSSIAIKASDGVHSDVFTVYKVSDGYDGKPGDEGKPAPIVFLTNENISFAANADGQITGTTVYCNVVAYSGTTKVTPTIGKILSTEIPTGMTIGDTTTTSNEIVIPITIDNNTTLGSAQNVNGTINIPITSPVATSLKLTWSKINSGVKGDTGVGISSVTVTYGVSTSASTYPTSWQNTIPTVAEGSYLWTRTITDYTDNTDTVTYTYVKQGVKGDTGSPGSSVTVSKIEYQAGTSATTAPTGTWSSSVVAATEGNYLWTKTTFSDGKVAYGVAKQGTKGDKGNTGDKGADAYTVMLTNESHIFAGNVSNAIASSTTTQVLAYKGSTAQSVTIVSVDGKTASTSTTATSIAGLSFSCSALSGTSPTITFTCTTSFVSPSGTIPIVLTVGGVTITKMFTYSIAFKGATGAQGSTGAAASLVDITPSALYFKSTTGKDGTFTPDYIYLYPRFQTVTFSKWEYSVNGGTTWVTASGANGLTIGTYNSVANTLRIAKASTLYTDTITSISFRCISSNTAVYDTVSIAKIYDVVDFNIGGRNYILNSTNLSVSGLGSSAGSRAEYRTIDVGQSYMNIENNTEVTISFDLEMTVNTANPTLMVYNSNRLGPKMFVSKSLKFTAAVGETIKQRCSIVTQITDRENPSLTTNTIEFYSTYDTSNWFKISNLKLEKGNKATDWSPAPEDLKSITFQLYAPKGYLITKDVPEITLETFAYDGSQPISGATFVWYNWVNDAWVAISGVTGTSLTLNKNSVLKSNVYKCEMTYKEKIYEATATIEDKTDIYESVMCISSNTRGNNCYWVLYTLVYTDSEEVDPLLGPISISAPSSPVSGDYWYAVDETNASVQLKKYNGTSWVDSTDTQSLSYYWDIINNGSEKVPFGDHSKVQVISCNDFTATATLMCGVNNVEDGLLTQSSLSLTDASDPIVSVTEPSNVVDGQLWIKPNNNGTYIMSIWDATNNMWVVSDMDTRTKVHTSKPSAYSVGDLWITASDTEHSDYLEGTLLTANTSSSTFSESHWSTTLKYDKDLDSIQKTLNDLSQYVNITSEGLKIGAQSASGEISPFTSLFTSTELAFYQNSDKLLTLANNQLTAPHIVVEDDLEIGKSISLGNLSLTIETNGSFSFAVQK